MTATGQPHDLILRGARVIDPSQNLDRVTDVRFTAGRVAAIGDQLVPGPATEVRDVRGKVVTPGLIDLHTHVYWGGTSIGVDAVALARTSATATFIDAGIWKRAWYYAWAGSSPETAYVKEMELVRKGVGLADVSTLGKIDIQGPDAAEFLNRSLGHLSLQSHKL